MPGFLEGEFGEKLKWAVLRDTVEGNQTSACCVFDGAKLQWFPEPIRRGAQPNLRLLAAYLRSDEPLPSTVRYWLADLMDPEGDSEMQFKQLNRRKKGAKPTGISNNWDAAIYALRRMEEGDGANNAINESKPDKWEMAVRIAGEKFRISESSVEAAIKSYRDAKDVHDTVSRKDIYPD